jgi:hypothetical protein
LVKLSSPARRYTDARPILSAPMPPAFHGAHPGRINRPAFGGSFMPYLRRTHRAIDLICKFWTCLALPTDTETATKWALLRLSAVQVIPPRCATGYAPPTRQQRVAGRLLIQRRTVQAIGLPNKPASLDRPSTGSRMTLWGLRLRWLRGACKAQSRYLGVCHFYNTRNFFLERASAWFPPFLKSVN